VVFVVDRYVTGSSMDVPFFGGTLRIPTGPIALALRTGAPVMAVFSWREGKGRSHGLFTLLDLSQPEQQREGEGSGVRTVAAERTRTSKAIRQAAHVYVKEMERVISAHPEQWVSALLHVWND
jgi:KDO2-lipid IV(A) lauroyltransferase